MASEAINLSDGGYSNQEINFSMCYKKTNSIVHAQQSPVELVAEFMMTAERELAVFYYAVFRRYGPKEGRKAARDWIEEVGTMDWPADGALPNWRRVTIVAADCLASRITDLTSSL
jgi:hypothetical protein